MDMDPNEGLLNDEIESRARSIVKNKGKEGLGVRTQRSLIFDGSEIRKTPKKSGMKAEEIEDDDQRETIDLTE
jgi:hypothetical protein